MDERSTFRGFLKGARSLVTHADEHQIKKMGKVRVTILTAAYSHLSDEEAVEEVRLVVGADPAGAGATLSYLSQARDCSPGYMTDRAYRILDAAITHTPPAPVPSAHAALFERERELGWLSLRDAFERLCEIAPDLQETAHHAIAGSPNSWISEVDKVVGPDAKQAEELARRPLASQLAVKYISAEQDAPDSPVLDRSVWDVP